MDSASCGRHAVCLPVHKLSHLRTVSVARQGAMGGRGRHEWLMFLTRKEFIGETTRAHKGTRVTLSFPLVHNIISLHQGTSVIRFMIARLVLRRGIELKCRFFNFLIFLILISMFCWEYERKRN